MKFQFSGDPVITAPRQIVWERLTDPDFIAASAPGVESVETVDPTHFTVVSGLGLGPMKVRFTMEVELFDVVERQSPQDAVAGEGPGLRGGRGERGAAGRSAGGHPAQLVGHERRERHGGQSGPPADRGDRADDDASSSGPISPDGSAWADRWLRAQRSKGRVAAERRSVGANGRAAAGGATASTTSTSRRHDPAGSCSILPRCTRVQIGDQHRCRELGRRMRRGDPDGRHPRRGGSLEAGRSVFHHETAHRFEAEPRRGAKVDIRDWASRTPRPRRRPARRASAGRRAAAGRWRRREGPTSPPPTLRGEARRAPAPRRRRAAAVRSTRSSAGSNRATSASASSSGAASRIVSTARRPWQTRRNGAGSRPRRTAHRRHCSSIHAALSTSTPSRSNRMAEHSNRRMADKMSPEIRFRQSG